MKKIVFFGLLLAGYWYWNNGQLPFVGRANPVALDSSGMPTTWVFTFEGCGASCVNAIKELRNRNVIFTEKVISPEQSDAPDFKLWKSFGAGNSFPLIVMGDQFITGFYAPNIAGLLGKTFGDAYLTKSEKHYFQSHFNADGSPRIVLYGTDWCGYCAALRKEFRENNVSFVDIDVEKQPNTKDMLQTMGISGYPATWVGYTRVIDGSNYKAVMALAKKSM